MMRTYFTWFVLWLFAAPWLSLTAWADTAPADFTLDIQIDPAAHELAVQAEIILPDDYAGKTFEFLLTSAVEVVASEPAVKKIPTNASKGFVGINGSSMGMSDKGHVARYQVQLPPGSSTLNIKYKGVVNFVLGDMKEQYTKGFRSTAGLIDKEGIFLAGSSMWYPYFGDELINFTLKSNVPKGWHLISQGNGSSRDEQGVAHWESGGAVDEIYLVGGPLVRYSEQSGTVTSVAYLHEADDALAQRYLTATAQYIQMYQNLVGPYPYKKFALVENFWETGYGMPSFTLLGPQIIRFPFILTSSYPHEILHNWWGNSVYVDYETGNWAEGLTSYMADHLIQEQNGKGAAYRRDTLKKYRDFVKEDRDFPLSNFRSRHSAATAAVGYGKTLMGFHMLRRKLGDEVFMHAISHFYKGNVGKKAGFADIRAELEANSKQDLSTFFKQWVEWTGAIDLNVRDVRVKQSGNRYTISGKLEQVQAGKTYQMDVPVNVTTKNGLEQSTISLTGKSTAFTLTTSANPLLLEIDPEFDLFRLLDPRETAPSIGQIFGEQEIIAVMPTKGDPKRLAAYRQLAKNWETESHQVTIVSDTDIDAIPADKAAWFFGANNRLAQNLFGSDPALKLTPTAVIPQGQSIPKQDHSSVVVRRHPANISKAIGWIVVDPIEAFPGVGRKLPHYSKYSFLGFAGQAPTNMVKGEWIATDSPLRVDLRAKSDQMNGPVPAATPPARKALTEIPAIPSRQSLLEHTGYLASEELGGRGLGTPGLEKAAAYIAEQFKTFGLTPAGDKGKYLQSFRIEKGEDGKPHNVANVVGVISGSNPDFDGQAVLVVAHYDHLGHGGNQARAKEKGKIHFGADDNASGVAVLLELARMFSEETAPQRSIVFIAFTGEESGLLGSKYYTDNPAAVELSNIMGVINLDTVGRLGDKDISVFGADSASEWQHIFRGIDFTIGIKSKLIMGPFASSDHQAFLDKGVPAVHISSGANLDYHRPTDTVEKIDSMGMINITTFSQSAISYLAMRPERLTTTITKKVPSPPPAAGAKKGSRVSLGTVPDFAFQGPGLRAEMVVPGSAAAEAGMQAGDVLINLDGKSIANLRGFSELLKTLSPDKTVPAVIKRDGQTIKMDIKLRAR